MSMSMCMCTCTCRCRCGLCCCIQTPPGSHRQRQKVWTAAAAQLGRVPESVRAPDSRTQLQASERRLPLGCIISFDGVSAGCHHSFRGFGKVSIRCVLQPQEPSRHLSANNHSCSKDPCRQGRDVQGTTASDWLLRRGAGEIIGLKTECMSCCNSLWLAVILYRLCLVGLCRSRVAGGEIVICVLWLHGIVNAAVVWSLCIRFLGSYLLRK